MNSFAHAAAEELFSTFPHWRPLARNKRDTDGSVYVVVQVAAPPTADVADGLVVDTSNDEITIGFDGYHAHFDQTFGDGERFGMIAAVELIQKILDERTAVVSWWLDEQWRGSALLPAGTAPEQAVQVGGGPFNRIRVRSWSGSLNADVNT